MIKENLITISSLLEITDHVSDLEGVVFDLDDTLYNEIDYIKSGFKKIASTFPQVCNMDLKLLKAFQDGEAAIDIVLKEEGLYSTENKLLCLNLYRSQVPDIKLVPEVEGLLLNLKNKKKLGLITDGRPEGQRNKIQALDLREYFDSIIITDELGSEEFRKPNPKAFQLMSLNLKCPYNKMCYIGDNLKKDFKAPLDLGMKCIWYKNQNGLYT